MYTHVMTVLAAAGSWFYFQVKESAHGRIISLVSYFVIIFHFIIIFVIIKRLLYHISLHIKIIVVLRIFSSLIFNVRYRVAFSYKSIYSTSFPRFNFKIYPDKSCKTTLIFALLQLNGAISTVATSCAELPPYLKVMVFLKICAGYFLLGPLRF